jgi:hypothetical protein
LTALETLFQNFVNIWIINIIMSVINFFTANYVGVLQEAFWVTYKSPKLLQQFATQTGIGSAAVGGIGQQIGRAVIGAFM